jgi:mannose-6-phosphate isomerase-like protein (cupin superfamily)
VIAGRGQAEDAVARKTPVVSVKTVPTAPKVAHEGLGRIQVAQLLGSEDFETSMMFVEHVEMPAGTSIGVHEHGDDEEFYFILSGSGRMVVDAQTYRVSAGDLVFNRRCGSHGLLNDSQEPLTLLVWQLALDPGGAANGSATSTPGRPRQVEP